MNKIDYYKLPYEWRELMLIRQAQSGNRISPEVFLRKIDASKSEGGFNFKDDKVVNWQEIYHWDGRKPLPECPLPAVKWPKEDTLMPEVVQQTIEYGGLTYNYLTSTDQYNLYATKDTIKGMHNGKKSMFLVMAK